jgi:large subunit ribosomal protein L32
MAVPKKRTSKSRKNIRKFQWKVKASLQAKRALSAAFSLLKKRTEISIENNKD